MDCCCCSTSMPYPGYPLLCPCSKKKKDCSLFETVLRVANYASPGCTPAGTTCCSCPNIWRSPRAIAHDRAKYGLNFGERICPASCCGFQGYRCCLR